MQRRVGVRWGGGGGIHGVNVATWTGITDLYLNMVITNFAATEC